MSESVRKRQVSAKTTISRGSVVLEGTIGIVRKSRKLQDDKERMLLVKFRGTANLMAVGVAEVEFLD